MVVQQFDHFSVRNLLQLNWTFVRNLIAVIMKNLIPSQTALTLIAILALSACKHEIPIPEDLTGGGGGGVIITPPDEPCDPDVVYFQQQILPLIQSNCAVPGCHSSTPGEADFSLTNYNAIINAEGGDVVVPGDPWESELIEVITLPPSDEDFMPQDGNPLSPDQIQLLIDWIAQGAINNSCENMECDTLNVTYSASISPIIVNKCQGCHSGASPQGNLSLTNHSQVANIALDGRLEGTVNHEAGFVAMPYQAAQLPQCDLDKIRIWVDAGAPNN